MEIKFRPGEDPRAAITKASARGLTLAAEYVLEQANRTVPHEEGTLQRSGRAVVNDKGTQAAVSYDTPYAVRQHEELTYRHNKGRRAKWLELTVRERADKVQQILAAELRGEL